MPKFKTHELAHWNFVQNVIGLLVTRNFTTLFEVVCFI